MLDRTYFETWQQRIRLYCLGKDNEENIMKSVTEGPFQMGTMRDTLTEGGEGALHLGPERARVFADLSAKQKDRYKADIRTINIILQGIPKDIYSHNQPLKLTPKIWDNGRWILEVLLKLNRGLKESHDAVVCPYLKHRRNKAMIQNGKVVVQDVCGRYNVNNQGRPFQRNNARGNVVAGNAGGNRAHSIENVHNQSDLMILDYFKDKMLLMHAHENSAVLDEEQLLFLAGEQVTNFDDDVDDLALNVDHVFEADQCMHSSLI
ncbi:hypothetical protein Tco_0519669 [Tanacetum coccineum]